MLADENRNPIIIKRSLRQAYKYHLRPEYGSERLLLEFILDKSHTEFYKDFLRTIRDINPKIDRIEDLWINGEVLIHVSSDQGQFILSRDNWDFVFVMADENQSVIKIIDDILNNSNLFDKQEVDFENYRT